MTSDLWACGEAAREGQTGSTRIATPRLPLSLCTTSNDVAHCTCGTNGFCRGQFVEAWTMASDVRSDSKADERAARIKRNRRAIALLRKWQESDDDEQSETWEFLRKALDEDRLSDRKLFAPS